MAWPGYVVGGTGGEQVQGYDWVTPFEKATGCKVTVKVGVDSANMVQLMKTGQYDGVSASGDATLRLIAGGDVTAVNLGLIPNYKDVFEGLKNQPYNTVDGVSYGVPHGRGANVLMYDPTVVTTAPDSWSVVFDADSPYKGKVTAYNYAIYIADAALYLMKTKPDLRIKNPYALDETQFAAAVDLLKQQKALIGKYWGTAQEEIDGFANGDMAIGTAWQYQAEHHQRRRRQAGRGHQAQGRRDRLVRHLDDLVEGQAPELHVQVDGLHHLAEGERGRSPCTSARRRSAPQACAEAEKQSPATATRSTPTDERTSRTSTTGTPRRRLPRRPRRRSAPTSTPGPRSGPRSRAADRRDRSDRGDRRGRPPAAVRMTAIDDRRRAPPAVAAAAARLAAALYRHPRAQLGRCSPRRSAGSSSPTSGSLALFLISSFWSVDSLSGNIVTDADARELQRDPRRRRSTGRSRSGRS